jgi:hypothetical protein
MSMEITFNLSENEAATEEQIYQCLRLAGPLTGRHESTPTGYV